MNRTATLLILVALIVIASFQAYGGEDYSIAAHAWIRARTALANIAAETLGRQSADASLSLDITAAVATETLNRQGADASLSLDITAAVATETNNRQAADASITLDIGAAVATETGNRQAADASLTLDIAAAVATETTNRQAADASITLDITAEIGTATINWTAAIATETGNRQAADASLSLDITAAIATESADRGAADASLSIDIGASVATETLGRQAADASLTIDIAAAVATETLNRQAADATMSADIVAHLASGVAEGIHGMGSMAGETKTNYVGSAGQNISAAAFRTAADTYSKSEVDSLVTGGVSGDKDVFPADDTDRAIPVSGSATYLDIANNSVFSVDFIVICNQSASEAAALYRIQAAGHTFSSDVALIESSADLIWASNTLDVSLTVVASGATVELQASGPIGLTIQCQSTKLNVLTE